MKTKIIKCKNYNSSDEPFEVMLYQTEKTYCVQVKNYEPDCWKNKENAIAYFKWFKDNKIVL